MTDPMPPTAPAAPAPYAQIEHRTNSNGIDFVLTLKRETLLPGHSAEGRVSMTTVGPRQIRSCMAALIATEQWKYNDQERDSAGNTQTVTRTSTHELQRLPVVLQGTGMFGSGQAQVIDFQVPVPPLGPATFEGDVIRLTWALEVKLNVAAGLDPVITIPVVVLQPTALLSAGVVHVGEFAQYDGVDVTSKSMRGRITLKPMPLCLGQPFEGMLELAGSVPSRLQGIRVELKVRSKSTVSGGLEEENVVWRSTIPLGSAGSIPLTGVLPQQWLPTVELPHGRSDATFDIVFDRNLAADEHLVRDVVLASTREL